ncbi:protein-serine O-palmitoleoyltransferase porcupine isoform X2 [Hyalella azteca]|uniref:Protein-serine O-palmitoleoyltransferase porcupine n=1 Tax=Hyalella azteca TaxID=294128 RepID=A0A979FV17_HYAAZ|nr:protein-serine O-palmitoleoyltransferase porcupine isoform X2 [Hyalella azteca]
MEFEYDYEEEDPADYYEYDYADLSQEIGFLEDDEEWVEENEQEGNGEGGLSDLTAAELLEFCVWPTLSSTAPHLTALLLWVLIFTLATRSVRVPACVSHALSCISGCGLAWQVFGWRSLYLGGQVVAGCLSVAVVSLLSKLRVSVMQRAWPWLITLLCLAYLLVCELWWVEATVWHSIRGAQMIILMKILSFAHDTFSTSTSNDGDKKSLPESPQVKQSSPIVQDDHSVDDTEQVCVAAADANLSLWCSVGHGVEFCGYLLHPGSLVFGPWCSVDTYRQILQPMSWNLAWLLKVFGNLFLSCTCLIASTCLAAWLVPASSARWSLAYRDALSFRLSHYFVCHMSEASALLGGLHVGPVARAHHIELPRSMLSVVTYWNVPMHTFLKKYVFMRVRGAVGVWCAVLCTYSTSAVIHGLNGQLCLVLLSLAVYTHAEHRLRLKLASAFSACVLARPCGLSCTHLNKGYSVSSLTINTLMGALCMWHLAYLGVMFDSGPDSVSGYSVGHTLAKWANLGYASHWVVLATYVFTSLV